MQASAHGLREFLGLRRNLVLLLIAIVTIGAGEETWMRFVPKYLESLGAAALVIGLYDGLKTLLGAVYAYPGGAVVDRWGHRTGLVAFTVISIAGYLLVLLIPRWPAVIGATFLFLAWSALSLPAMFSLVAASLSAAKHTMGIGIQSLIKRLPILIGPVVGGLLIDQYGVLGGVRAGLVISIVLGLVALMVQRQIQDDPFHFEHSSTSFLTVVRSFDPPLRRLLFSDILVRFCERIPYAWVVIYAMDDVGVSATKVGVLTAIEMIVASACYVPVAYLAERYGREPFVIATFFFFTLFPLSLVFAHSFALLVVAFAIRGLKEFGDSPRKALIVGYARPEMRGRTVGAYYLIRDTFVSAGSLLGAWLWRFGPAVNFWGAAALGATGTAIYCATLIGRRAEER
ncbi:MAG TPA: MFS transporter [Bryobacteraceae bacterium]|nr:MFS transporter [Bryobacteraceae bacterium]